MRRWSWRDSPWGAAAFVYFRQHGGLPADLDSMTAMPRYLGLVLPAGILSGHFMKNGTWMPPSKKDNFQPR